tara:strand:+ start:3137 stop:4072 length:936 start_codon:yes stop_codon:yes gene_type:complete
MRLLLLGCTGFIGRQLIPDLLNSGHHLIIISRNSSPKLESVQAKDQLTYLQLDPSEEDSWQNQELVKELAKSNGVINLTGEPIAEKRWSIEQREKIQLSRLNTTKGLINAMNKIQAPPNVLINASAIGFYGTSQEKIFNEDSPSGEDFLSSVCQDWESIALQKPASTRIVITRIGIVLGADGGALGKMLPIFRAGFGGPIGNGKQWMSWIHRRDLCQMIEEALINKKWEGIINAVAPEPERMSVFSESLGKVLGKPSLLPVPGPLLKLLLGDGAKIVLEGQNVISKKLDNLKFKFKYPNLKDALIAINKEE